MDSPSAAPAVPDATPGSVEQLISAQLDVAASADVDHSARVEVQRLLFVLEALLTTHLWKEDTAYVPLLAGLDSHAYSALHADVAGQTAQVNMSTERAAIR